MQHDCDQKPVPDMTYNVFGGTLNLAQSNPIHNALDTLVLQEEIRLITLKWSLICRWRRWGVTVPIRRCLRTVT